MKQKKGITLIALIVTIIVLIILAGVSINMIFGNEGIFSKAQIAANKYKDEEGLEVINLKVDKIKMIYYSDYKRTATLEDIMEELCTDEEVEYIKAGKLLGAIEPIDITGYSSILVKLKAYENEFEIGEDLQVAVVNKGEDLSVADGRAGIVPTGNIDITSNGEYDVTNYAKATVNVPANGWSETRTLSLHLRGYGNSEKSNVLTITKDQKALFVVAMDFSYSSNGSSKLYVNDVCVVAHDKNNGVNQINAYWVDLKDGDEVYVYCTGHCTNGDRNVDVYGCLVYTAESTE